MWYSLHATYTIPLRVKEMSIFNHLFKIAIISEIVSTITEQSPFSNRAEVLYGMATRQLSQRQLVTITHN